MELDLGGGVKLKMVRIPAKGKSFWMGSPEGEKDRDTKMRSSTRWSSATITTLG